MGDLLPPGKMIPAQSMRKHDGGTAAGALVVDFRALPLNKAARNGSRISRCGRLLFLRLTAGRHNHASRGKTGKFRKVTPCDHVRHHSGIPLLSSTRPASLALPLQRVKRQSLRRRALFPWAHEDNPPTPVFFGKE